jgi:hypothetical protein
VPQERRRIVEDDEIEELAGHFAPEPGGQLPDGAAAILLGLLLVDQDAQVVVAVLTRPSLRAAAEEEREPHPVAFAKGLDQSFIRRRAVHRCHPSTVSRDARPAQAAGGTRGKATPSTCPGRTKHTKAQNSLQALLFAPAARLGGDSGLAAILLIWLFPLGLAMAHDAVARRRIERVYIVGLAIMLVAFARVGLMESEGWLTLGRRLLGILTPL